MDMSNEVIKAFHEKKRSKFCYDTSRNEGILEFNNRVLSEIFGNNTVPENDRLMFSGIVISNMLEFIGTRYQRFYSRSDQYQYIDRIEDLLNSNAACMENIVTSKCNIVSADEVEPLEFEEIPLTEDLVLEKNFWTDSLHIILIAANKARIFKYGVPIGYSGPTINLNGPYFMGCHDGNAALVPMQQCFQHFLKRKNIKYDSFAFVRPVLKEFTPFIGTINDTYIESAISLNNVLKDHDRGHAIGALITDATFAYSGGDSNYEATFLQYSEILDQIMDKNSLKVHLAYQTPYLNGFALQKIFDMYCKKNHIANTSNLHSPDASPIINLSILENRKNILFETPYISYRTVLNLIHGACYKNPSVFGFPMGTSLHNSSATIFITLYRSEVYGSIIEDLVFAAHHGVNVFVYLEKMARDNEVDNLSITLRLRKNGIHVLNTFHDLKVHGKAFLAFCGGRGVAHISTGNYESSRAKTFTDFQFITRDNEICEEILNFFRMIMQNSELSDYSNYFANITNHMKVSPISVRHTITNLIANAKNEIFIKCNSMCDQTVVNALYDAAKRGVKVRVLCRTSCMLNPSPKYPSLEVKSNTGEYLEHGRLYKFDDDVYMSSADMLLRNMNKRVEILFRIPEDIQILGEKGARLIERAYATHDTECGRDENTLEDINDYLYRIFTEAKWTKNTEEDYKFDLVK